MEELLDKILNILYDQDLLHWKKTSATDILIEDKGVHKFDVSNARLQLAIDFLETEKYIKVHEPDEDEDEDEKKIGENYYSLTGKGIMIKEAGGFVLQKHRTNKKNRLIDFSYRAAIVVLFLTAAQVIFGGVQLFLSMHQNPHDRAYFNNTYYNCYHSDTNKNLEQIDSSIKKFVIVPDTVTHKK